MHAVRIDREETGAADCGSQRPEAKDVVGDDMLRRKCVMPCLRDVAPGVGLQECIDVGDPVADQASELDPPRPSAGVAPALKGRARVQQEFMSCR